MITCDKCRMENADDAQYCDECGTPLDSSEHPAAAPVVTSITTGQASTLSTLSIQGVGFDPTLAQNSVSLFLNGTALSTTLYTLSTGTATQLNITFLHATTQPLTGGVLSAVVTTRRLRS